MQCPRCGLSDGGRGSCPACGSRLDYFRSRVMAALARLELGHPIGRDLAVVEHLGRGPTGIAYKVQDTVTGEVRVLKFVTSEALYDEENVERFKKRMAILQEIVHPNLAAVREVRETESGYIAVVMEYVDGPSLSKFVSLGQRVDLDGAYRIVRQAGEAVAQVHAKGILHRNLRPCNILMCPEGDVKVTDFAIPAAPPAGTNDAVAQYAAPEVAKNPDAIDHRADIYSLGKILYQLVTNQPPTKIVSEKIPANLRKIVARSTAPEASSRYASLDEFLRELDGELSPMPLEEAAADAIPNGGKPGMDRAFVPNPAVEVARRVPVEQGASTSRRSSASTQSRPRLPEPTPPPPPEVIEEPLDEVIEEPIEEPAEGKTRAGKYPVKLEGHKGYIHTVAVSPDDELIASGASDSTIRVWKVADPSTPDVLTGHRGYVYSAQFTGPKRLVSVGMDAQLRVWNLDDPASDNAVQAHEDRIFALAADSARAYTAGMDGKIKLWSLPGLTPDGELPGHGERIYSLAVTPDGKFLASASMDKTVKVWALDNKKLLFTLKGHGDRIYAVAFTPDGRKVFSGSMDETVRSWSSDAGKEMATLKGHSGHVYCVAVSPDGRYLVSGSMDKTVKIWDLTTNKVMRTSEEHEGTVSAVALAPGGRLLVTGSYDSFVRIWDFRELLAGKDRP